MVFTRKKLMERPVVLFFVAIFLLLVLFLPLLFREDSTDLVDPYLDYDFSLHDSIIINSIDDYDRDGYMNIRDQEYDIILWQNKIY